MEDSNLITREDALGYTEEFLSDRSIVEEYCMGTAYRIGLACEFNVIGEQKIYEKPIQMSKEDAKLSVRLLKEELQELEDALEAKDSVAQLDALLDIQYVLDGVVGKAGLVEEFVYGYIKVHENNMTKFVDGKAIFNKDGKIIKPEGYKPLDLGEHFPHLKDVK